MSDVFISYARRNKAFVQRLHKSLADIGRDVWVDWEDIPPTADWWREIQDGIDEAHTFVFVITPDSAQSEICYKEIDYAVSQNKRLVPILYQEVTDPDASSRMHPAIGSHNWVFFRDSDDFEEALKTLLTAVDTDLDYVRKHTQLLVQARDWVDHDRGLSYLIDGQQIRVAEQWLAEAYNKTPEPTDLHIEFIRTSRHWESSRQRRLFGAAIVALIIAVGLAIFGFIQSSRANTLLGESQQQGTQIAVQVTDVAAAQRTAEFNYSQAQTAEFEAQVSANDAQTQQFFAEENLEIAETARARSQNLLATSEAQSVRIVSQVTSVAAAQFTAEFNYNQAQTAEFEAQVSANDAQTQEYLAVQNADRAELQQIIAENAANTAQTAEARAQNLLVTSEFQGNQIALEVTNVAAAQSTAEFNAQVAQTEQFNAEISAFRAQTQEARAQNLLVTSEFQAGQIALEVTNVAAAQSTAEFNAQIAQTEQFNAEISANNAQTAEARAQNLLVTSEVQGTQIALEVTNVSIAQATSVYNEQQALAQSLAVNADLAIGTGNYDLAFALALEAFELRPDLTQAQRVLNQIVFSAARFSFDDVLNAQFTPDSDYIFINTGDELLLWEIASRKLFMEYEGFEGFVNDAVLSEDGTRLVAGDSAGNVILWDTFTGEILRQYAHDAAVGAVAINSDNTRILSGDETSLVYQWDTRGDIAVASYAQVASRPIRRLEFSPNESRFFVWSDEEDGQRFMSLRQLSNGNNIFELDDESPEFETYVDINPLTGYAYGDETNRLRVWEYSNNLIIREISRNIDFSQYLVGARAFNNAGNRLMVVLESKERGTGTVVYYNLSDGGELVRLENNGEQFVGAVAVSPEEDFALTGDVNELVLWNMDNGREVRRFSAHNDAVDYIEFSDDGRWALSWDRANNLRVWDIAASDIVELGRIRIRTQLSDIYSLGFASDNTTIIAGLQTSIFSFNALTREQIDRVDPGGRISNVIANPSDAQILAVLQGGTRMFNANSLTTIITDLYGQNGDTYPGNATFSRDGSLVVYETDDRVYVRKSDGAFDRVTFIPKSNFMETFNYEISDLEITPDNTRLVVVVNNTLDEDEASEVLVLDIATGEPMIELENVHRRQITDIAINTDGTQLATASYDNDIYLWNLLTGDVNSRLVGHVDVVERIEYVPGQDRLLSASYDTRVILWDTATSQMLRDFRGHIEPVLVLAVSANGEYAVTSTGDSEMLIWRISGDDDTIDWAFENRYIPELSCIERIQYSVEPLCSDVEYAESVEENDDDFDDDEVENTSDN